MEARRRPRVGNADSGSKGGKLFYLRLACRRCTLFSLKNALSRTRRDEGNGSAVHFEHSFSISLFLSLSLYLFSRLIPSFFISSLARFSSSMVSRRAHAPLSVETEVASGFFMARDRCASRSFPHDYATRELLCSLEYNFESRAKLFPDSEREREQAARAQKLVKVRRSSLIALRF